MRISTAVIRILTVSMMSFCGLVYAVETQVSREPADTSLPEQIVSNESPGQVISGTGTLTSSHAQNNRPVLGESRKAANEMINNAKPYSPSVDGVGDLKK